MGYKTTTITTNFQNHPSLSILGSLLEMNDPENALRAFKQSTRLASDDPIVLLNSTTCLLNCGMRQEAEELLNRCRDLQEAGKMVGVNEEVGERVTRVRYN